MTVEIAAELADTIAREQEQFEALLAAAETGNWQANLRLIFALESAEWQRALAPAAQTPPP